MLVCKRSGNNVLSKKDLLPTRLVEAGLPASMTTAAEQPPTSPTTTTNEGAENEEEEIDYGEIFGEENEEPQS